MPPLDPSNGSEPQSAISASNRGNNSTIWHALRYMGIVPYASDFGLF